MRRNETLSPPDEYGGGGSFKKILPDTEITRKKEMRPPSITPEEMAQKMNVVQLENYIEKRKESFNRMKEQSLSTESLGDEILSLEKILAKRQLRGIHMPDGRTAAAPTYEPKMPVTKKNETPVVNKKKKSGGFFTGVWGKIKKSRFGKFFL